MNRLFLVMVILAVLAGCSSEPDQKDPAPIVQQKVVVPKEYPIAGVIVSFGKDRKTLILDHNEVKGFLPAGTREFTVGDPALVADLTVGDDLVGSVYQQGDTYVLLQSPC